ncbi:MAG: hypothetical protein ACRCZQ_11580, partial [Bacteroidales bacterium]
LFLAAAIMLMASCSNDDDKDVKKKGLNPDETAIIKAGTSTRSIFDGSESYQDSLNTVFEAENYSISYVRFGHTSTGSELGESEVDRVNKRFTLRNIYVVHQISANAPCELGFLPDMEELVFTNLWSAGNGWRTDTIAYVPTKVLKEVGAKIKAAFAKEDYEECRRLLQNEYIFKPIDAKGYKALKAAGLN